MNVFDFLIEKLHNGKNPYAGFPAAEWGGTWYGDPGAARDIFKESIKVTNASTKLIIEVGSFIGESAIHMSKFVKPGGAILCVDTWYAGFDHWKGAREKIQMHFGRPDFYYKFIANVITRECQDRIVPFAMDSIGAARVIGWLGLVPQLIYVDASHEKGDVLRDYEAYWALLPSGGGMLVDDLSNHFPGVVEDWTYFTSKYNLKPKLAEGEKALIIKP